MYINNVPLALFYLIIQTIFSVVFVYICNKKVSSQDIYIYIINASSLKGVIIRVIIKKKSRASEVGTKKNNS